MTNSLEILGAVEIVLGLGSRIYKFFSDVKDAPEEVRQMCAQLQLLQKLFPEIARSTSELVYAMPLSLEIIFACLKGCETEFNTLWLAVEPLRTEPGIIWSDVLNKISASVKWVVKTEEFEKFTKNLETAKQTLALAMLLAGMRVDSVVLDELSSIDTKLDTYGRTLNFHLHHVHKKIAFQLEQLEYRFLQRIDILSGAVAEVHGQNNFRVTELYDSITPNGPLPTGDLSTVQSVDSNVDFAVSSSGTPDIDLVDFPFGNQQGDIANQIKKKDIEILDSLLPGFRDAIRQWEAVAYANGTDDFENTAVESSGSPFNSVISQLKEGEERQAAKRHNRFGRIFEKIKDDFTHGVMLVDTMEFSTVAFAGMGVILEAAKQWEEYFELIREALREMQDALETCTREYELYPEPKLKVIIMKLYTESFSGMTIVLKVLREKSKPWTQGRNTQILKDTIAKIRRSSQKVMKEVEYLHRRELRQAHLRLREIDKKQDQVIRALDEQKKILIAMQEEQKALNLINDHQKVVQMLQQLLAKFPPPAVVVASMGE
ncbi:hypothetical protein CFAM422_003935 [Trichoderma lentiforme]|uniref:Fungal N-terminal domain-containing protein n=1 Tax=Trichoderma lentiforme TaxID=1567552 RepID=A0A9P5CDE3_9HYPO|nr:hypothetical protein CFAM422_003935 [Trichoderma lentiforme]